MKSRKISGEIQDLASGRFDDSFISEFISKFHSLSTEENVIDFFLQISTDEGDELELGFFTEDKIFDLTLSKGKIYSCCNLLSKVRIAGERQ